MLSTLCQYAWIGLDWLGLNATFNIWRHIVAVSYTGGGNRRPSIRNWRTFPHAYTVVGDLWSWASHFPLRPCSKEHGQFQIGPGRAVTRTTDLPLERSVTYHWTKVAAQKRLESLIVHILCKMFLVHVESKI